MPIDFTKQYDVFEGITFNENVGILSGTEDPTVVDITDGGTPIPITTLYLRTGTLEPEIYIKTGTGVNDWGFLSGKVEWKNIWIATQYNKNDMVRDGDWTMIANKQTTDRAAPVPAGEPEHLLPTNPTWASQSNLSNVEVEHTYTFAESGWVPSFRIWPDAVSSTYEYRVRVTDITDPSNPITSDILINNENITAGQWNEIQTSNQIVLAGSIIKIELLMVNSSSDTLVSGGWTYDDQSVGNTTPPVPLDKSFTTNGQFSIVYVDKDDLNSTDRSSELLSVTPDSTIKLIETGDVSRNVTLRVEDDPIDFGSYVGYITTKINTGSGGEPTEGETTTIDFIIPVPSNTNWVEEASIWNQPQPDYITSVTSSLSYDGVDQAASANTAYGVDFLFQRASVSDDWDLVATSQIIAASGGGGGGGTAGDVPAVLARRSTNLPITDTFVTITFDTTDFKNYPTIVDHDDVTNTSRITVKEDGLYEFYFQASGLLFTANGELFMQIESRLIKNGVLVAIPGVAVSSSGYSGGPASRSEVNSPNTNIILDLLADDYIEVQIRFLILNGATGVVGGAVNDSIFWATKQSGARGTDGTDGEAGPPGSGSSINVYDEGTVVPNSPFTELNFIGDAVTATDAGGGRTDITITGGQVDFDRQGVQTGTLFGTTSQTFVDITGSTLTTKNLGDTGHYIITFSCEFEYDRGDKYIDFALNVGGATVLAEKTAGTAGKNVSWRNFSMTHLAPNVASGTIIKMQVLTQNGDDLFIVSRELVIDGVLSSNVLP